MKKPHPHPFPGSIHPLAVTALAMTFIGSAVQADSISYSFSENASNQQLDTSSPKGPRGSIFWNDSNDEGATPSGSENALIDDEGNPTEASITWSSTNTWYNGSGTGSQNARILVGYLDDGAPGLNVTINNIPYAKYNVYGIVGSDQGAEYTTGDFNINGRWAFETVLQQASNEGSLGAAGNTSVMTGTFLPTGALAGADQPSFQTVPGQTIKIPYHASLNPSGPFTVEAWLKPGVTLEPGSGTVTCALSSGNFADPRSGWLIYQTETGWNFRTYNQNGLDTAVNITGGPVPEAGTWYHVVAVWDGSVGKLFVNGSPVATSPATNYVAGVNGDFHLGSRSDGTFAWDGAIDEVAFYAGALADSTIASHHTNGNDAARTTPYETLVQASSPIGYWRGSQTPQVGAGTAPAFGTWSSAGEQWIRINHTTAQRGNYWRVDGVTGSSCVIQGQPRAGSTRASLTAVIIEEANTPDRLIRVGDESFLDVALGAGLISEFRPGTDVATVTGENGFSVAATHTISVVPLPGLESGTYPLIHYSGSIGGGGFGALNLAPSGNSRYGMTLVDNAANQSVDLQYTAPDAVLWTAANGTAWDTGVSQNWKTETGNSPTTFQTFDVVKFDDDGSSGTVVIDGTVSPVSVQFDNDTLSYTVSGGAIGGSTGILKTNFGTVTLLNDNTFTGPVVIEDGKLVVGDGTSGSLAAEAPVEVGAAAEMEIDLPADATLPNAIDNKGATLLAGEGALTVGGKVTGGGLLTVDRDGTVNMTNSGQDGDILVTAGSTLNLAGGDWAASFFANGNREITVESDGEITTGVHTLGGLGAAFNQPSILLEENAVWRMNGEQYLAAGNLLIEGGVVSISLNDLRLQAGTMIAYPSTLGSLITGGAVTLYGDVSFDVSDGAADEDLVIQSPINENAEGRSVTKLGAGRLSLTSTHFSGRTHVTEGVLSLSSPGLSDTSIVNVATGATLELDFSGQDHVAGFEIDGVAQAPGLWGRPGSIAELGADHESPLISGNGLLAIGASDPFGDWLATNYPGLTGNDALPGGDPDGDGLDNLTEFAFDGDPTSGAASGKIRCRLETVEGQTALVITIPVRGTAEEVMFSGSPSPTASVDGLDYSVHGSDDLVGFDSPVIPLAAPLSTGMPALNEGWHYRSFRLDGAIPARGAKGFLRAAVE